MATSESLAQSIHKRSKRYMRRRNACILVIVCAIWLALDIATKRFFNSFEVGQAVGEPFFGIFRFVLVHNTGGAWGIFGNMTAALGILAVLICALLLVYLFVISPRSSFGTTFGLALVIAGGIGNTIDRFTLGYVVDFIKPVFIDFPVFNIADTGVTCGIIIFIISLIFEVVRTGRRESAEDAETDESATEQVPTDMSDIKSNENNGLSGD